MLGAAGVMLPVAAWGARRGRCEPTMPAPLSWDTCYLPFISHMSVSHGGVGLKVENPTLP